MGMFKPTLSCLFLHLQHQLKYSDDYHGYHACNWSDWLSQALYSASMYMSSADACAKRKVSNAAAQLHQF